MSLIKKLSDFQKYATGVNRLGKTGLITSYNTGDDYDINHGLARSFETIVVAGKELIYDHITNLVWIKNINDTSIRTDSTLSFSDAISACESLNYGGFTDWHLPNIYELFSIVSYKTNFITGDLSVFTFNCWQAFQNQEDVASKLWSSTSKDANTAFYINFRDGIIVQGLKTEDSESNCFPCRLYS